MSLRISLVLAVCITVFSVNRMNGQCDNQVSTFHMAPYNNNLPNIVVPELYLNHFDWVPIDSEFGLLSPYNTYGLSPTLQLTNNQIMNIYSSSTIPYYEYLWQDVIPTHENGWELVSVNLGYFPSGLENNLNTQLDFPFIVIYNRFRGVMRVYGVLGPGLGAFGVSYDAVKISIDYFASGNKNGTLRLNGFKDMALDQPTLTTQVVSLTKHPNQAGKWFSADFQIAYDPCVCFYPSNFHIICEFIQSHSIGLYGRSIAVQEDLINGNNVLTLDFLSTFDYSSASAEDGMVMYKHMASMVDDYIAKMEAYQAELIAVNQFNDQVERDLALAKAVKTVLQFGDLALLVATGQSWFTTFETSFGQFIGNDKFKLEPLLKEFMKILGRKTDKYISENVKKKELPTAPAKPTATFSEMRFEGTLEKLTEIPMITNMFTPGTYGSGATGSPAVLNTYEYPVYNSKMGLFALLETPKLEMSKIVHNHERNKTFCSSFGEDKWVFAEQWLTNFQFSLAEPLKFAFNDEKKIKGYEIEAQWVFNVVKNSEAMATQHPLQGLQNNMIPEFGTFGYEFSFLKELNVNNNICDETNHHWKDYATMDIDDSACVIPWFDSEVFYNVYPGDAKSIVEVPDYFVFYSPVIPLNAFQPFTVQFSFLDQVSFFQGPVNGVDAPGWFSLDLENWPGHFFTGSEVKIIPELKLHVDIFFDEQYDNGEDVSMSMILTYDIPDESIVSPPGYIVYDLANSPYNFGQYPETAYFKDINFNGEPVDFCELNGSLYTCKAWSTIYLDGTIETSGNYQVDFIANEIVVQNDAVVSPHASLFSEQFLDFSQPMSPATDEWVAYFCNNNDPNFPSYQAHISGREVIFPDDNEQDEQVESPVFEERFSLQVFPNPFDSDVLVLIDNPENIEFEVVFYDLVGRSLLTYAYPRYDSVLTVDLSAFSGGMYLCVARDQSSGKILSSSRIIKR